MKVMDIVMKVVIMDIVMKEEIMDIVMKKVQHIVMITKKNTLINNTIIDEESVKKERNN
jgi:hypothetical protein